MLGYLLPIRKEYCDQIFKDQRKFFEFRRHFDQTFKGRIFVYESGKDGCHKVIGFFDTERIGYVVPGKEVTEDFDRLLDAIPEDKVDEVLHCGERLYCIPIVKPQRFTKPRSLQEWSQIYKVDKMWTMPPRSRARIDFDVFVECWTDPVPVNHYQGKIKAPYV